MQFTATSIKLSPTTFWERHQRVIAPWLFLAPALTLFAVYVVAPIIRSIGFGFYSWDGLSTSHFIGFGNYFELYDDPNFWIALENNFIWLACFLLAVPAGLFFRALPESKRLRHASR